MDWTFEEGSEADPAGPRTRWEVEGLSDEDRRDYWLPVIARPPERLGLVDLGNVLRERGTGLRLPSHEADLLRAEAAAGPRRSGLAVQVYAKPLALADLANHGWDVLQVGAPVVGRLARETDGEVAARRFGADPSAVPFRRRAAPPPRPLPPGQPVLAVIDDAIGFLHQRFQAPGGRTRFRGVWLQATRSQGDRAGRDGLPGRVVEPAEIEALIALRDEARAYAMVNDALVPRGGHRATERRAGHGTHVLDLAAGAWPGEGALAECPLLAVQLPPGALALTASRQLDDKLAAALRWIMARALPPPGTPAAPLIVTLSVGSFGAPLDGSGALERQVAEAVETYRLLSGGQEMRVVVAFGNARRARAVARGVLAPGEALEVDWRILPDDWTDSWLALHVPLGAGPGVALGLSPPGGLPRLDLPALLGFPAAWALRTAGGTRLAAVFGAGGPGANPHHDGLRIAVEATARGDGRPTAPSGAWRAAVQNRGASPVEVSLRVERDDTPLGYRLQGRQSWLDHPDGWSWEGETGGWTGPGGPITRVGTATNLAGLRDGAVYLVAGGERPAGAGPLAPTRISAEGGPGSVACPTLLARSDDGRVRPGRRAAGILTGSTSRMAGTSVAAPLVARALARLALNGRLGQPAGDLADAAELEALTGGPTQPPDPRAGRGTLSEPLP